MLRVAICDDEILHCQYTAKLISKCPNCNDATIHTYASCAEILDEVKSNIYLPDIAVLDICMGQQNGIELARELNTELPHCQVIFLTSYIDYAPHVYEVEHVYLVLKSQMEEQLPLAFTKAIRQLTQMSAYITTADDSGIHRIPWRDVLYLERILRKTHIITSFGKYISSSIPQQLLETVNKGYYLRCHHSFYVNVEWVSCLSSNSLILTNGVTVPVSRAYLQTVKKSLFGQR